MNSFEKTLKITPAISLNTDEIEFEFIKSSGPGGQNVNKVSTGVRLRFNILNSKSISADIKSRLFKIAINRINKEGYLIVESQSFRTQAVNKKALLTKFVDLLIQASIKPKKRVQTKPSKHSVQKRLDMKNRRSKLKQTRKKPKVVVN